MPTVGSVVASCLAVGGWLVGGCAWAQCAEQVAGRPLHVIELYTSEGCESCPPADRWLSQFKGRADVAALAFHVDYFDHLGWKDRFASPAFTRRQNDLLASSGARFLATPQVIVDGQYRQEWGRAQAVLPALPVPPLRLNISRAGDAFSATLQSVDGQAQQVAAFWVVVEDGHRSEVTAGENANTTLQHDGVVRDYRKVKPWELAPGTVTTFRYEPSIRGARDRPRQVLLVVTEAATARPLLVGRFEGC